MNRYLSLDEAFLDLARRLSHQEPSTSRNGPVREVLNWCFTIDPQYAWLTLPGRALSPRYAAGETLWYLSGSDKLAQIAHYAPSYGRFSDDGLTLNGAYGARLGLDESDSQLDLCLTELKKNPDSRRAVMQLFSPTDLLRQSKDKPCTVSMQMHLRDGQLHWTTFMRSNDLWLGLPYDVFAFTVLQRYTAGLLNATVGSYTHMVGSMHMYERDRAGVERCLDDGRQPLRALGWPNGVATRVDLVNALYLERVAREDPTIRHTYAASKFTPLRDLAYLAAETGEVQSATLVRAREIYADSRRKRSGGQDNVLPASAEAGT